MKLIRSFDLDLSNLPASGIRRSFSVRGDNNAVFSLEIKNEDNHYYNFSTRRFSATKSYLKEKVIKNNIYTSFIDFPAITDDDHYDIVLTAEHHYDTRHVDYIEARFADNTIDINSSIGSNSTRLSKIIYQYTDVTLTLSAFSPNSVTPYMSGAVVTETFTGGRYSKANKKTFKIKLAANGVFAFTSPKNATEADLLSSSQRQIGSGIKIQGEDIYGGAARSSNKTVDGAVTSGTNVTMDDDVGVLWAVGDRITGNAALDAKTGDNAVTITAINVGSNAKVFTMSEAIAIADGETLTFTPPRYHRWSIHSSSSIHNLFSGMTTTATNLESGSFLKNYVSITEIEVEEPKYDQDMLPREKRNVVTEYIDIPAVDPGVENPTYTNGVITSQLGNVCFNQPQFDLASDNVKFYASGSNNIKFLTGYDIRLSNVKVELTDSTYVSGTKPTTTTTGTVSNSTTIGVADREGIIQNLSTISGIGIDPSVANPTITSAQADGAGNWTASAAQTLESGITLTIDNTSRYAIITGEIEINQFGNQDSTVFFNLENLLTAD